MNLNLLKIKNLTKFIFILFLIPSHNILAIDEYKLSENEIIKEENKNIFENNNIKSQYLLGDGDVIFIEFYGLDIYSRNYPINPEGFLTLPEIGEIYAANFTLQELKEILTERYKDFIINPTLQLTLTTYKPITVYISGEIRRPGLYNFAFQLNTSSKDLGSGDKYKAPTNSQISNIKLYDALKNAKGVTNYADLSNIKLIRKNSKSQGGGKITTKIDLLSSLVNGDLSQNIRLYDEDYIFIPKSEKLIKKQLLSINNLNLNPDMIKVFITGNVVRSGEFVVNRGTSLTQAVASSGGKKLLSGRVEFLRFNDDGTTENYKFRYDHKASINTKKNPILMEGDVINVNSTLLGKSTEILREIANPILSGYGLYNIFN